MAQLAAEAGERVKLLPPGKEPERLLTLARESENASYVEEWLNSPALLSPR
jgi:hypothetical protein